MKTKEVSVLFGAGSIGQAIIRRVAAAVYGGGRRAWPLQLQFRLRKDAAGWRFTHAQASTY